MQPTVCAKQVVISELRRSLNLLGISGTTMGTHVSFMFRGYNPYIGGLKPLFFYGFSGSGELAVEFCLVFLAYGR